MRAHNLVIEAVEDYSVDYLVISPSANIKNMASIIASADANIVICRSCWN
jgi:sulfopyruvate decarboxylase TPP-binding subunit